MRVYLMLLLEAMYEEVPCIVSKVDGNNDVISNRENGFSCLIREQYAGVNWNAYQW